MRLAVEAAADGGSAAWGGLRTVSNMLGGLAASQKPAEGGGAALGGSPEEVAEQALRLLAELRVGGE